MGWMAAACWTLKSERKMGRAITLAERKCCSRPGLCDPAWKTQGLDSTPSCVTNCLLHDLGKACSALNNCKITSPSPTDLSQFQVPIKNFPSQPCLQFTRTLGDVLSRTNYFMPDREAGNSTHINWEAFYRCEALTSERLKSWDVYRVENIREPTRNRW